METHNTVESPWSKSLCSNSHHIFSCFFVLENHRRKHFLPGRRIYLNCKFIVLTIHKQKGKIDNSCGSNVLFIYVLFLIYIFNFSPPVLKYIVYVCLHVYTYLKKKKTSERTANCSYRTEIARPKGTVVSAFGMQKQ